MRFADENNLKTRQQGAAYFRRKYRRKCVKVEDDAMQPGKTKRMLDAEDDRRTLKLLGGGRNWQRCRNY